MKAPARAKPRLRLTTAWRVPLGEHIVRLAPSEAHAWVAGAEGTLSLLALDGAELRRLRAHGGGVLDAELRPGGRELATCGQAGVARVWTVDADAPRLELAGGAPWVEGVAWSPDGERLATAAGRVMRVWSAEGELLGEGPAHPSTIADLVWVPPGPGRPEWRLASAAYGGTWIHAPALEAGPHLAWKGSTLVLAPSPDGRYLATGDQDSTVHIWRPHLAHLPDHDQGAQMSGFERKVLELSWHHGGRYLATGGGEAACRWDCRDPGPEGRSPALLVGAPSRVTALAYQRRGDALAVGRDDGTIESWLAVGSPALVAAAALAGSVTQLAWDATDGLLCAGSADGEVAAFVPPDRARRRR